MEKRSLKSTVFTHPARPVPAADRLIKRLRVYPSENGPAPHVVPSMTGMRMQQ